MMASEGWLTTAIIMLQQADEMRHNYLGLDPIVCCGGLHRSDE